MAFASDWSKRRADTSVPLAPDRLQVTADRLASASNINRDDASSENEYRRRSPIASMRPVTTSPTARVSWTSACGITLKR